MGEIVQTTKQKLVMTNLFCILVEFFSILMAYWTNTINIKENASRLKIWGPFNIPKGEGLFGG